MRLTDKTLKQLKQIEGVIAEPEYRGKKVRALFLMNNKDLSLSISI